VATWNLNSLRARVAALDRFLERVHPDVLCLQETKASDVPEAARSVLDCRGYTITHVGRGAWNGVAVAARHPIGDVRSSGAFDDEHLDREPRVTSCVVEAGLPLRVASVYVPHGRTVDHWHYEYKLGFLDALGRVVQRWLDQPPHVVVAGDLNVAATDSDVFHALGRLLDVGLVDVDQARWGPRSRRFTWWNHGTGYSRNLGMRLDVIAADRDLAARLDTTWVDHHERAMERSSDHAAVVADFHVEP
jgi:exodeoxyribonuclease-3